MSNPETPNQKYSDQLMHAYRQGYVDGWFDASEKAGKHWLTASYAKELCDYDVMLALDECLEDYSWA